MACKNFGKMWSTLLVLFTNGFEISAFDLVDEFWSSK